VGDHSREAVECVLAEATGEISNGAVEGLNNKIRVVTRRSYGFRTYDAMEIALYHNLGRLPEPEFEDVRKAVGLPN
jgi:Transposase